MRKWLVLAAALPLFTATAAGAQMKALSATEVASVSRAHTIDLRIANQQGYDRPMPLMRGMLAQEDVADNAFIGVGLANIYARKKRSLRADDAPVLSRRPAVTFVLKF
jgi:hypothetical protein